MCINHLFVFMRCGDIHGRTSFVILCNASMKRNQCSLKNKMQVSQGFRFFSRLVGRSDP